MIVLNFNGKLVFPPKHIKDVCLRGEYHEPFLLPFVSSASLLNGNRCKLKLSAKNRCGIISLHLLELEERALTNNHSLVLNVLIKIFES